MTEKMTRFDPVQNGLRFSNTFATDIIWGPMHITTGGRCGGISYTALDCFFDGEKIPSDTTRPPEGAVLNTYIYERQMKSLAGTADQWVDFLTNPFGLRTGELHNRGRRGGGEFQKLIGEILQTPIMLSATHQTGQMNMRRIWLGAIFQIRILIIEIFAMTI